MVFKNAKNAPGCRLLRLQSHNFPVSDIPACAYGAWTQTPISAWLASVSIVPVLRNDNCCKPPAVCHYDSHYHYH